MIRALAAIVALALVATPFAIAYVLSERRRHQAVDRREIVLEQEIQQNARDNYRLLERTTRLLQRVLDADAVLPSVSKELRDELRQAVAEFHEQQPPKGSK